MRKVSWPVLPRRTFATWLDDTVRSIRFAAGTVHTARTVANTGTSPISTAHDLLQSAANSLCTAAKSIRSAANLVHASSPSNDPSAQALCARLRLSANWLASAATPLRSSPPSIHDALQVAAGALRKAASSLDTEPEPRTESEPQASGSEEGTQTVQQQSDAMGNTTSDRDQKKNVEQEQHDRNMRELRRKQNKKLESSDREREELSENKQSEQISSKDQVMEEQETEQKQVVTTIKIEFSSIDEDGKELEKETSPGCEDENNKEANEKDNNDSNNHTETEKNIEEDTLILNEDNDSEQQKQHPEEETENQEILEQEEQKYKFSLLEDNIHWETPNGCVSQLLVKHNGSKNAIKADNKPVTRTREETEKIVQKLHEDLVSKKISFHEAIISYSDCASRKTHGVVIKTEDEEVYHKLRATAESLKCNEVSEILETCYGFHILYCSN
ncbi:unnamed protein product [Spodoptera exigua]|nr:unnamed protein product [Spodoptera exigua]